MTDLLQKIRAKCIEVNPEIVVWSPIVADKKRKAPRPIRLADVLLAMKNVSLEVSWFEGDDSLMRLDGANVRWNLREDDLEKQSEETIKFIGSVLGV